MRMLRKGRLLSRNGRVFAFLVFGMALLVIGSFLTGCATRDSTKLIRNAGADAASAGVIEVPAEVSRKCEGAALPPRPAPSREEYRVFGYAQTERLVVCEGRRANAVTAMELHNQRMVSLAKELKPKPWWKFW